MAQKKVTDIKEVDKSKQLDNALGQIERQFGSGTVMRMGAKPLLRLVTLIGLLVVIEHPAPLNTTGRNHNICNFESLFTCVRLGN